ncbi:endonuclease [Flavobacteriaceae bacterium]|nr:endonuclease [Flavobacteriaceae bacterium]MDB2599486.1 endonuclease [Flavobacteriaceae bacterium]
MHKSITLIFISFFYINTYSQLFINEIDSDTDSLDQLEFIEIKSESPNFSLDGYIIVLFNGSSNGSDSSYLAIDLNGFQTDLNGLFLIGNNNVSPSAQIIVPNNSIQNGADAVAIYQAPLSDFPNSTLATTTNLVDALVYDTSDSDDENLMQLLGVNIQINENENGNKDFESIQRSNNGSYFVDTPTPREVNEGNGVFLNGINFSFDQDFYNEGDQIQINFTTEEALQESITIFFNLEYQNFDSNDYSDIDNVTIQSGEDSASVLIDIIDDEINEGDEDLMLSLDFQNENFILLNNNQIIRVNDNDFIIADYGTPINPTYANVNNLFSENYYSNLNGLAGEDLIIALKEIISNPELVRAHSYSDIKEILKQADVNPENSNQVWLVYTEQARSKIDFQTTSSNIGKWNREHTFPRSRGGFNNISADSNADGIDQYWQTSIDSLRHANSDAHGIRASDGPENSSRGNKHYGDYNGPTGNLNSFKGDVARSVLFLSLRYNGLDIVDGFPDTVGQLGDLQTILSWNELDPVDDFEKNRNNVIYNWQNNRNPLIDLPEIVNYIWGENYGEVWFDNLNISVNQNGFEFYPNPTNGNISFNSYLDKVEVYSLNGQKLLSFKNVNMLEINLEKGLYLIFLYKEGKSSNHKIIIN